MSTPPSDCKSPRILVVISTPGVRFVNDACRPCSKSSTTLLATRIVTRYGSPRYIVLSQFPLTSPANECPFSATARASAESILAGMYRYPSAITGVGRLLAGLQFPEAKRAPERIRRCTEADREGAPRAVRP